MMIPSPPLRGPRLRPPASAREAMSFLIPGLDLKVHYGSRTDVVEEGGGVGKRAQLFTWISVHSLPAEIAVARPAF